MLSPKPYYRIKADGICIYVSVEVTNPLYAKVSLLVANLFFLFVAWIAIIERIPGLLLITILILVFLVRYTLWNFYGRENLIITKKAFSYQHEFGFFKTSQKTIKIDNRVVLEPHEQGQFRGAKQWQLNFISYREDDDLPFVLYAMSLYIPDDGLWRLEHLLDDMFTDVPGEDVAFPTIFLN
jgi:hypothetical protein